MFSGINLIFIYSMKYTYDINLHGKSSLELWLIVFPIVFLATVPIIYVLMKLRVPDSHPG
jgi:hypothetical protein